MDFKTALSSINSNSNYKLLLIKLSILVLIWVMVELFEIFSFTGLNEVVIGNLILHSSGILSQLGYQIFIQDNIVGITGTSGLIIGAPCNALDLMTLFLAILYLLPGKIRFKIIYGLAGIVLIHLLNLARIVGLLLLLAHHPEYLGFNHDYTFTLIMYVLIFTSWMFWVKLIDKSKKNASENL